jgi:site-specific recombinase XerC
MIDAALPAPVARDPDDDRVLAQPLGFALADIPHTWSVAETWLQALAARQWSTTDYLSPGTYEVLTRNIRVWLRYLANEAKTDAPDHATVLAFRAWAARTRRSVTVNTILEAVRTMYHWAGEHLLCDDIAAGCENLTDLPEEEPLPGLDDAAFAKAVSTIAGDDLVARRNRCLVHLLRTCPVDSIALARANCSAVDLAAGIVRLVPRAGISLWKRGLAVTPLVAFPLVGPTAELLRSYLELRGQVERDDPLFIASRTRRRMSPLSMRLAVLRMLIASGQRTATGGVAVSDCLDCFPTVSDDDLMDLERRLPSDAYAADRARALIHLIALRDARIAWHLVPVEACAPDLSEICREGRTGARRIALPEHSRPAVGRWVDRRRAAGGGPLFVEDDGRPAKRFSLRQWAWEAFPERLPHGRPAWGGGSTRRLQTRHAGLGFDS